MRVGGHQLDAAQTAVAEAAQERDPERLGLAVADGHAQDLAPSVCVDGHGDNDGDRDKAVVSACFDVGRLQPQIRPLPFAPGSPASLLAGVGIGRERKAPTRSSISPQSRETWLLLIPSMPRACTRLSTLRVEMPWTRLPE